jgi:hypothetical protein
MMTKDYGALLKKSWKSIKRNPIIFLPSLISLVFFWAIAMIKSMGELFGQEMLLRDAGKTMLIAYPTALSVILLILFLGATSLITSMQVGINKDIIQKGSSSVRKMVSHGASYFWIFFKISVFISIVLLSPFLIILLITGMVMKISLSLGLVVGVLLFITYLVFLLIVIVELIFLYAIIASRGGSARHLVSYAMRYALSHNQHTISTALICFFMILGAGILMLILELVLKQNIGAIFGGPHVLIGISEVVKNLVWAIASSYLSLFIFYSYFEKKRSSILN